jgi:hypothetical protein
VWFYVNLMLTTIESSCLSHECNETNSAVVMLSTDSMATTMDSGKTHKILKYKMIKWCLQNLNQVSSFYMQQGKIVLNVHMLWHTLIIIINKHEKQE